MLGSVAEDFGLRTPYGSRVAVRARAFRVWAAAPTVVGVSTGTSTERSRVPEWLGNRLQSGLHRFDPGHGFQDGHGDLAVIIRQVPFFLSTLVVPGALGPPAVGARLTAAGQ